MNRKMRVLPLFVIIPLLTAMGSPSGARSPGSIPVPEKKYTATFIDQDDVVTECRDVSIEGGTFLEGKKGEGTYTISFDSISSILFLMNDGKLKGIVKIADGADTIELVVSKDSRAYGHTKFGTFQIRLGDLKKIIIGGVARKRN